MAHEEQSPQSTMYVHVAHTGDAFIIAETTTRGMWIDGDQLRIELQRLKDTKGVLWLSWDEEAPDENSPQRILEDIIRSFDLDVRPAQQHPAVMGYHRSYTKSLWEAVDLAEQDIQGTETLLADAENFLSQMKPGSEDYTFWKTEAARLKAQLASAKDAHKKLKDLELELTHDPVGGEN